MKNESKWYIGSEINFSASKDITNELDIELENYEYVIDYTKVYYPEVKNVSSLLKYNFGEVIINFIGINKTDYYNFYNSRNTKKWLSEGDLSNLNEETIFLSRIFKDYNFEIGDTIDIIDNKTSLIIGGFINAWPTVSTPDGGSSDRRFCVISSSSILETILENLGGDYFIKYQLHTKTKNIISTVEYFTNYLTTTDFSGFLNYIDFSFIDGLKKVFLSPVILLFEMITFVWGALFLFTNFEDVNTSEEAKILGIIGMVKDYKRSYIWIKLVESAILFSTFIILLFFVFLLTNIIFIILGVFPASLISFSMETISSILVFISLYFILLILQIIIEYYNFRKLNLSLMFRHPE